jgi:hypothetical protein
MAKYLEEVRNDLINGRGFTLFLGLPVREWEVQKSATASMGIGAHFGYLTSQNGRGHVLGHIKDLGENSVDFHKVRLYRTTARHVVIHHDKSTESRSKRIHTINFVDKPSMLIQPT